MIFEPVERPVAGLRQFGRDIGGIYIATAIVAFLFSSTGPVAIIISVGLAGGLSEIEIGSWIFAACVFSGLMTIGFSLAYRQPLSFAWTIPGTVLLASALDHLSFAEVIGAFWVTALLLAAIGFSGSVRKAMRYMPMPVVLAMVAGIFLQFGLDLVLAFESEFVLSAAMVLAYVGVLLMPGLGVYAPPVVMALVAGIAVVLIGGDFNAGQGVPQWLAWPVFQLPQFSQQALFELVLPLAITVLVAQNAQGFAVLMNSGHRPPVNNMTIACGAGAAVNALFGAVSTCVTGPSNAVLASAGERLRQYTAGVVFGALMTVFGIFAFAATWLIVKLPAEFIAVLAGLALLPVLLRAFVVAFSGRFQMSALIALLVTVSDVSIWNIGAPFWGLVIGLTVAALIEREDFRAHLADDERDRTDN